MTEPATRFAQALQARLESSSQLPTLPVLLAQVERALANEMTGVHALGQIIERDPALATKLLKVANSALFTRGDPITTIGAAVTRLGLRQVRSVCLAVGVVRAFGTARTLDHRRYWEHSAAVALLAERLTQRCQRYAHIEGAEAYVAGLVHDVGLLILDQFFPAEFAATQEETDAEARPRWQVEIERLGIDHGEVAGNLLARWQLPGKVIAAVTFHHRPDGCPAEAARLAELVWAAESLSSACGLELPAEGVAEVTPDEVLDRVKLAPEEREPLLAEVGRIGELAGTFAS
jgi:HD-like signal output (HDOD) protein